MREIRLSGSEGGGAKPIVSPYPYLQSFQGLRFSSSKRETPRREAVASSEAFRSLRFSSSKRETPRREAVASSAAFLIWSNPTPSAQKIVV
jgi:hypothetical protein